MPPMKSSSSSCLISTATVPMAPPSASEPTSPMKISAGWALYQRKPRLAPVMDAAEDGQLADLRHAREFQIVGEDDVAAGVGEHGERAGGDDHAADGEPVQPVGEVDGVRWSHHHQRHEDAERQERQRRRSRDVQQSARSAGGWKLLDERDASGGWRIAVLRCRTDSASGDEHAHEELVDAASGAPVSPRLRCLVTLA